MKPLSRLFFIAISISSFAGCDNNNQKHLNALKKENAELRQSINTRELDSESGSKFVFVVLYVEQTEGYPPESMTYTKLSGIEEISYLDEDRKYQLMDQYQAHYLQSVDARAYKGIVKDREIKIFDTYAQASKAKEQIVKSHSN